MLSLAASFALSIAITALASVAGFSMSVAALVGTATLSVGCWALFTEP
jgi:hypothetical protein